jgi:hypothetical protein
MEQSIEHYKQIAEKRYNKKGSISGDPVSGDIFQVRGQRYILNFDNRGYPVVSSHDTGETVEDTTIVSSVVVQMEKDRQIAYARRKVADTLSENNPILAEILEMHIEYNVGRFGRLLKKDGIDFYAVGHNASHYFYAGTKDGKKYVFSMSPNLCECDENDQLILDEKGNLIITEAEEHIREVTGDDWGYIGHY